MIKKDKVLCTICARGGSKGVKNKNIKEIGGKPLIAHTVIQAIKSNLFEHVVISTDSDVIAEIAVQYGAEVFFKRDASMATDNAGKLDVIRDAFMRSEKHYDTKFDFLVDLDATAPLRKIEDIQNAVKLCVEDNHANVITAMPSRRSPYFNLVERIDGKVKLSKSLESRVLRRQDAPETFDMNASIYVWQRDVLLNEDSVFLDGTGLYVMPEERSIDIDTPLDYEFVSFIMSKKNA